MPRWDYDGPPKTKTLSIRITEELYRWIEEESETTQVRKTDLVVGLLQTELASRRKNREQTVFG